MLPTCAACHEPIRDHELRTLRRAGQRICADCWDGGLYPEVAEPMLPKFMCRHCGFEVEAVGQPMCCGSNMAAHPDEWGRRQVALQPCGHPVSAVVSSNEGTADCECDIEDANHG